MDIDRIKEIEDDAAIDALVDMPFVITDADYMGEIVTDDDYPAAGVYNTAAWHSDCADILISDDPAKNDYIRNQLAQLLQLFKMASCTHMSTTSQLLTSQCIAMCLNNIGGQILENAIANGLNINSVGER
jgi:hypothetical protein